MSLRGGSRRIRLEFNTICCRESKASLGHKRPYPQKEREGERAGGGSAGKACCPRCPSQADFHPGAHIKVEGKNQAQSCPLAFTCTLWHTCSHKRHTHTIIFFFLNFPSKCQFICLFLKPGLIYHHGWPGTQRDPLPLPPESHIKDVLP